jgi:hypothetical protein
MGRVGQSALSFTVCVPMNTIIILLMVMQGYAARDDEQRDPTGGPMKPVALGSFLGFSAKVQRVSPRFFVSVRRYTPHVR